MTDPTHPTDAELIAAFRRGHTDAFAALYQRHVAAAYSVAQRYSDRRADDEDLVSTAFMKVLSAMRGGHGPDSTFRAYLLTAVRNCAYAKIRRDRTIQIDPTDDLTVFGVAASEPFLDTALAALERSLVARAYERLSPRWQTVLWHIEVEGLRPVEVAGLLGITANATAVLAHRARAGLREAYLLAHLSAATASECRATRAGLAAWTRGRRAPAWRASVAQHLDTCAPCRSQAAQLAETNAALRSAA